jgi:hypothetical protein
MGALTEHERRVMKQAGFLDFEIKCFNDAVDVNKNPIDLNFQAENFQSMIRSRIRWISLLKSHGWDKFQIDFRIKMLYRGHRTERNSFILLQAEASPSQKNTKITDNAEFRRRLARNRVTRTMGHAYGKDFKPTPLPKHLPKPPETPRLIKD